MGFYPWCALVHHCAMPAIAVACAMVRPCGISFTYLLLALVSFFTPVPTKKSMKHSTGLYYRILKVASFATTGAQLAFQIVLFSMPPYGGFLERCAFLEKLLRHIGLIRYDEMDVLDVVQWATPDLGMLLAANIFGYLMSRLTVDDDEESRSNRRLKMKVIYVVSIVGKFAVPLAMCVAGILRPSVVGGLYFLTFICCATWWACYKPFKKMFAVICRCLAVIVLLHICALYLYQLQWAQEYVDQDALYTRLLGLTPLFNVSCDPDPRSLKLIAPDWPTIANPFALVFLFAALIIESRLIFKTLNDSRTGAFSRLEGNLNGPLKRQVSQRFGTRPMMRSAMSNHDPIMKWQVATRKVRVNASFREAGSSTETTPLMQGLSGSRYGSGLNQSGAVHQDSSGSIVVENKDDIPLRTFSMDKSSMEDSSNIWESIMYGALSVCQIVINSSYLGTNIIMMAWSITYHSWITFVFLLWANILWMWPNQRRAMLRSSPFIVLYAICLLIAGYIYSMNLTEDELPSVIKNVNLEQIGFNKVLVMPFKSLMIKCLYTTMFWITMRQYMRERAEARRSSALADMVAPLQVTVTAATSDMAKPAETQGTRIATIIGEWTKKFFTKYWICIVAITLFISAITGNRMTGFRIVYMALFLFFITTFQISFKIWRKIMFGFWLTVILYSMIILVLIYTYQFDHFSDYWSTYLKIPEEQQLDLGLEHYETKQLFVRLLTPTFFVVITVIQLHYFHKDFLKLTNIRELTESQIGERGSGLSDPSSAQGGLWSGQSPAPSHGTIMTVSEYGKMKFKIMFLTSVNALKKLIKFTLKYLEIHISKVVYVTVALLCVFDVASLHLVLVFYAIVSLIFGRKGLRIGSAFASVFVSVLLLLRMIYQIKYISHEKWDVECNVTGTNETLNTAEWFGFYKTSDKLTLAELLKWYIAFHVAVTLCSLVILYQKHARSTSAMSAADVYFVFPKATRHNADRDIVSLMKYLANFGFYKFGLEICLVMTVITMGVRMDVYAIFYGFWLCLLFPLSRNRVASIWKVYLAFIVIMLPVQYVMVTGLPPFLCIEMPWNQSTLLQDSQIWLYLMDPVHQLNSKKLICDFILLMFVSRQELVFRIERRYDHREFDYMGGSNKLIIHLAEEPGFVNPIPDYVTTVRSWLDILKRIIFQSFFWITLAIMFLAGTNRVNIFSIGYLIGAFIFLWMGNDFYLRPIDSVLRKWGFLVAFNVAVILCKTLLQIPGCLFLEPLSKNCCWVVQLLGIGCFEQFRVLKNSRNEDLCPVPEEEIGIAWDGLVFVCLLIQRRIFQSFYFFHMIDEIKATTILASRGAELIEELKQRQTSERREQECNILQKIKFKMDRIKATQQKIQGPKFTEEDNHYVETRPPLARSPSLSSCISTASGQTPPAGYHTPIDEEEEQAEEGGRPDKASSLTPAQPQAPPSPSSALMTVSLEAYLEPQRISFSSPPNSELVGQRPASPDDSCEAAVFSGSSGTRWSLHRRRAFRRRLSAVSAASSRRTTVLSHQTYNIYNRSRPYWRKRSPETNRDAVQSGDYYMFDDDQDDDFIDESPKSSQLSDRNEDMTLGEFLSTAMKTDIPTSLKKAYRRVSLPAIEVRSLKRNFSTTSAPFISVPQPTTSQDEVKSDRSDVDIVFEEETEKSTVTQKLIVYLLFFWTVIERGIVSITNFLNRFSEDYRYVIKVLSQEKKNLKEKTSFQMGHRRGTGKVWEPMGSYHEIMKRHSTLVRKSVYERSREVEFLVSDFGVRIVRGDSEFDSEQSTDTQSETMSPTDQLPIVRLLLSIWYLILSHSDIFCYFAIFINQMRSATILSLPLPLMVFLWGTLSIPRPSKTFWVTIIAYTEVIVLIKCMFQFDIWPWNDVPITNTNPMYPPLVMGIERKRNYAAFDLTVLLIVFFHRFMLKSLGLWKSQSSISKPLPETGYYTSFGGDLVSTNRQFEHASGSSSLYLTPTCSAEKTAKPTLFRSAKPKNKDDVVGSFSDDDDEEEKNVQLMDDQLSLREESADLINITVTKIDIGEQLCGMIKKSSKKYCESIRYFFVQLLDPTSRVSTDVYAYMFMCDFFNFMVIIFGFSAFGTETGDGGVSSYIQENKVPIPFLVMLMVQFILIIIDRALFLRKYILGKIVFQFLQIAGIHVWMFFVLPIVTERSFHARTPPQLWYFVKCLYFLLSAYQIRCGYPTRILGNFLCKGYNYLNMFLFKAFMAVPFLFELRTIMDWMWTDTSMTILDWLKMEDIFAHIFQLKCSRHVEKEYPTPRGVKKGSCIKYFTGGTILIAIISIIWFPLVFFALGNTVGDAKLPDEVKVSLRIGPYEPLYEMTINRNSIHGFSEKQWQTLMNVYKKNRAAQTFFSSYVSEDIAAIALSADSTVVWSISPPDSERLLEELISDHPLEVHFHYEVYRYTQDKSSSGASVNTRTITLPANDGSEPNKERQALYEMVKGAHSVVPVPLRHILPKFLKVTNRQTAVPVDHLIVSTDPKASATDKLYRDIEVKRNSRTDTRTATTVNWWEVRENTADEVYTNTLSNLPFASKDQVILYTFNDKIFPPSLNFLTGAGIISLYTTSVLLMARFIRAYMSGFCFKIMFDDLPYVDRVLQLCLDIYLVRESRELSLEEDLFAKLVFLFRSPETLIKWTRPKQSEEGGGGDAGGDDGDDTDVENDQAAAR